MKAGNDHIAGAIGRTQLPCGNDSSRLEISLRLLNIEIRSAFRGCLNGRRDVLGQLDQIGAIIFIDMSILGTEIDIPIGIDRQKLS